MATYSSKAAERFYENQYEDYTGEHCGNVCVVNNKVSYTVEFASNLSKRLEQLLSYLDSNKQQALKCGEKIYAGLGGMALLSLLNDTRKDSLPCLARSRTIRDAKAKMLRYVDELIVKDRVSFLNGDAGILALAIVFYHKNNDHYKTASCIQKLLNCSKYALSLDPSIPDELLYGRAGYLYSLLFVRKHLPSRHIPESLITEVINAIIKSGRILATKTRESHKAPLRFRWHDKEYIGAAHGYCGILHTLLLAYKENLMSESDVNNYVKPTIDYVLDMQYPSKNLPSSVNSSSYDVLVQWCHGAPGAVHIVALAFEIFKEEKYLKAAVKFGEVAWNRGILTKGYSLCHGVAGNGYTFIKLYQLTGQSKYLYRATKFAEWCFDYGSKQAFQPDRPWSLFEGLVGVIHFLIDLLNPAMAKFPGVEI